MFPGRLQRVISARPSIPNDTSLGVVIRTGREVGVARYVIRGTNDTGVVEFNDRLTIEAALQRAAELGRAHFKHITIVNVFTGVEITDVEALIDDQASKRSLSENKVPAPNGQNGC